MDSAVLLEPSLKPLIKYAIGHWSDSPWNIPFFIFTGALDAGT